MSETPPRDLQNARIDNLPTLSDREKANIRAKLWFQNNKERRKKYIKQWSAKNVKLNRGYQKKYRMKLRQLAIAHYSNNKNTCSCCRENHWEFLSLDHIDGGGAEHRRLLKVRGGHNFYQWLKTNNYPKGYRVLCMNCNMSWGSWGYCPHESQSMPL